MFAHPSGLLHVSASPNCWRNPSSHRAAAGNLQLSSTQSREPPTENSGNFRHRSREPPLQTPVNLACALGANAAACDDHGPILNPPPRNKTHPAEAGLLALLLTSATLAYDPVYLKWNLLVLLGCGLLLALRLVPRQGARLLAIQGAVFFTSSCLLGLVFRADYVTLPPNHEGDGITTDSLGFRSRPKVNYGAKPGIRIFAIGGSTTEEIQRADDSTWPHLLQVRLASELGVAVEVVNTGVSGLRSANHLATLKQIEGLQPDMVVVLMGINDWNAHIRQRFSRWHRPEAFNPSVRTGWRNRLLARNTLLGRTLQRLNHDAAFGIGRPKIIPVADRPTGAGRGHSMPVPHPTRRICGRHIGATEGDVLDDPTRR